MPYLNPDELRDIEDKIIAEKENEDQFNPYEVEMKLSELAQGDYQGPFLDYAEQVSEQSSAYYDLILQKMRNFDLKYFNGSAAMLLLRAARKDKRSVEYIGEILEKVDLNSWGNITYDHYDEFGNVDDEEYGSGMEYFVLIVDDIIYKRPDLREYYQELFLKKFDKIRLTDFYHPEVIKFISQLSKDKPEDFKKIVNKFEIERNTYYYNIDQVKAFYDLNDVIKELSPKLASKAEDSFVEGLNLATDWREHHYKSDYQPLLQQILEAYPDKTEILWKIFQEYSLKDDDQDNFVENALFFMNTKLKTSDDILKLMESLEKYKNFDFDLYFELLKDNPQNASFLTTFPMNHRSRYNDREIKFAKFYEVMAENPENVGDLFNVIKMEHQDCGYPVSILKNTQKNMMFKEAIPYLNELYAHPENNWYKSDYYGSFADESGFNNYIKESVKIGGKLQAEFILNLAEEIYKKHKDCNLYAEIDYYVPLIEEYPELVKQFNRIFFETNDPQKILSSKYLSASKRIVEKAPETAEYFLSAIEKVKKESIDNADFFSKIINLNPNFFERIKPYISLYDITDKNRYFYEYIAKNKLNDVFDDFKEKADEYLGEHITYNANLKYAFLVEKVMNDKNKDILLSQLTDLGIPNDLQNGNYINIISKYIELNPEAAPLFVSEFVKIPYFSLNNDNLKFINSLIKSGNAAEAEKIIRAYNPTSSNSTDKLALIYKELVANNPARREHYIDLLCEVVLNERIAVNSSFVSLLSTFQNYDPLKEEPFDEKAVVGKDPQLNDKLSLMVAKKISPNRNSNEEKFLRFYDLTKEILLPSLKSGEEIDLLGNIHKIWDRLPPEVAEKTDLNKLIGTAFFEKTKTNIENIFEKHPYNENSLKIWQKYAYNVLSQLSNDGKINAEEAAELFKQLTRTNKNGGLNLLLNNENIAELFNSETRDQNYNTTHKEVLTEVMIEENPDIRPNERLAIKELPPQDIINFRPGTYQRVVKGFLGHIEKYEYETAILKTSLERVDDGLAGCAVRLYNLYGDDAPSFLIKLENHRKAVIKAMKIQDDSTTSEGQKVKAYRDFKAIFDEESLRPHNEMLKSIRNIFNVPAAENPSNTYQGFMHLPQIRDLVTNASLYQKLKNSDNKPENFEEIKCRYQENKSKIKLLMDFNKERIQFAEQQKKLENLKKQVKYVYEPQDNVTLHDATFWLPINISAEKKESLKNFINAQYIYPDIKGVFHTRNLNEITRIAETWEYLNNEVTEPWKDLKNAKGKLPYNKIFALAKATVFEGQKSNVFAETAANYTSLPNKKRNPEAFQTVMDEYKKRENIYLSCQKTPTPFDSDYKCERSDLTGRFLPRSDPRVGFFGNITSCCQHFNGVGKSCAIDSMINPNSQLFVIENIKGDIIAGSWVYKSKTNFEDLKDGQKKIYETATFDNIEVHPSYGCYNYLITQIYKDVSKDITKAHNLRQVTFGSDHTDICKNSFTPTSVRNPLPKNCRGAYSDAKSVQYLLETNSDAKPCDEKYSAIYTIGACQEDLESMNKIAAQCFPEGDRNVMIPNNPSGMLLYDENEGAVGYIVWSDEEKWIYDMAVLPEYRRSSTLLVNEMMDHIREEGGTWGGEFREGTSLPLIRAYQKGERLKVQSEREVRTMNDGTKMVEVRFDYVPEEERSIYKNQQMHQKMDYIPQRT